MLETIEHKGETHTRSRIWRTVLAFFILIISVVMIGVKYVYLPIVTKQMPELPIIESVFHIVVIVAAILMFDPKTGAAIADKLLAKLPGVK